VYQKLRALLLALVIVIIPLTLGGCQVIKPKLGTAKNPVKLYFVPSVEVAVIVESGEAITAFLKEQTGLEFEVKVPTTYAAVIEELGAAEADAMAFIPAMGYVLAADKYGTEVALATERYGWAYYWAEYVVAADSDIESLQDLKGKTWAYPSTTSTSGYLVPASYFAKNGIEPGKKVEAGGHPQAVTAVYEGQADFGTAFFSAPGDDWKIGDDPEPAGDWEYKEVDGKIQAFKGGQRIRDARTGIINTYPDVCEKVRILAISDPIPNDTVSFCKDFPVDARAKIVQGLLDYVKTEEGQKIMANQEFYDITGFSPVGDAEFNPIRDMIKGLGLQEADILK
jgi:phosphonate transport system substrate-binding protein